MRITARVDYALRATVLLAGAPAGQLLKAAQLAADAAVPRDFLETILRELRLAGLVWALRGAEGGYALTRSADQITVADIVTAVHGADDSGRVVRVGDAVAQVWAALDAATKGLLEAVTLADVAAGLLPDEVRSLLSASPPGAPA
jgi:Rrf2 family protein